MASHSRMKEFNSAAESWVEYVERLEQYFIANDIGDAAKKRAILLSVVGSATYHLIRSLAAPARPSEKTYGELVELVTKHHNPAPTVTVQRYKFHTRMRQPGESVANYLAALRTTSEHCEFGESISDMLRDRLVCSIGDSHIQRKLLAEAKLTYDKVVDIALSMEAADKDARDIQKSVGQTPRVHQVKYSSQKQKKPGPWKTGTTTYPPCYRCGGKHSSARCHFRDSECHNCGKTGHLRKMCNSSRREKEKPKEGRTNLLEEEEPPLEEPETYGMYALRSRANHPIEVTVTLNGVETTMEVDTGASRSIISEATYQKLWYKNQPIIEKSSVHIQTYTGEELDICGKIQVQLVHNGQQASVTLLVVKGDGPSLIGRDWLSKLRLDWSKIHHLRAAEGLNRILDK